MDKETLQIAANRLLEWEKKFQSTQRLERHEAMKAILFGLSDSGRLEHQIIMGGRKTRIDFIDDQMAVEINDSRNEKSLRKLAQIDDRSKVWILLLTKGKGGQARHRARRYGITILRIFLKPRSRWEWIYPLS